jgi:tetratricopeptide (TPR) repeat protein
VVVGYRVDGWRSGVFHGVIPTSFKVLARDRVSVAVKNVGTNTGQMQVIGPGFSSTCSFRGYCPPWYGVFVEHWNPGPNGITGSERDLLPTDWPVTLPPGISKREAKTHDFKTDRLRADLKDHLVRSAKNPQDALLVLEMGGLNFGLTNRADGEEAYEKFFKMDVKDFGLLNIAVWLYVDSYLGTNLGWACEAARKAHALAPQNMETADTLGWVLVKLGEYREAIPLFRSDSSTVQFHLGIAHYMLMEEDDARKAFRKVTGGVPREVEEAKICLSMLDFSAREVTPETVAKLKKRLLDSPDDPVALDRLGELVERPNEVTDGFRQDPLVLKAVGMRAYRRADWPRAVECLRQSAKDRAVDAELFFYLGLACNQLNQKSECADSLRKALALHLKPAHAREATNVVSSASTN